MKKIYFLLIIVLLFPFLIVAQNNSTRTGVKNHIEIKKMAKVHVAGITNDWKVSIQNMQSPMQGNPMYKTYLKKIKEQIAWKYPRKYPSSQVSKANIIFTADTPMIGRNFVGNEFTGSVPNDNTMAISDSNMLMSAINTTIRIYDIPNDTLLKTISLTAFTDSLSVNSSQYDPKLLYDPQEDKFVMACLAGFTDSTSNIVIGFSETNNPLGLWNLYALPGNPLNDTSWSDFPSIALTNDELFLSINLLRDGGTWQTSFKQTVVWQIDKMKGYAGDSLATLLWTDIKSDTNNIRNMNPIQGGDQLYGPDIYLLSDKNFSVQCDSIFVIHITGNIADTSTHMTVAVGKTDRCYGVPPQAHQIGLNTFDTNDARILGGFLFENKIQFVANTIDTTLGSASYYHGFINDLSDLSHIHGNIISDTLLDFGYPNIAYAGLSAGSSEAIIVYNHVAPTVFAGSSATYYHTADEYSPITRLKAGLNYVDVLASADERWGDYSGVQRKYNEPGKVWAATSYGKKTKIGGFWYKVTGTWISELLNQSLAFVKPVNIPESANMRTYPNPCSDFVFVEFDLNAKSTVHISLFDVNGRLVKKLFDGDAKAGTDRLSFSTEWLKKGIYFVKISDNKKLFSTQKIIVQ
jgi:hypothetical protein